MMFPAKSILHSLKIPLNNHICSWKVLLILNSFEGKQIEEFATGNFKIMLKINPY